jgi:hypothetical protein
MRIQLIIRCGNPAGSVLLHCDESSTTNQVLELLSAKVPLLGPPRNMVSSHNSFLTLSDIMNTLVAFVLSDSYMLVVSCLVTMHMGSLIVLLYSLPTDCLVEVVMEALQGQSPGHATWKCTWARKQTRLILLKNSWPNGRAAI